MVARVDGKSPVEYLTAASRICVRELGSRLLLDPPGSLDEALLIDQARGAMTPTISEVRAREILDSGGRPTVEVDLVLDRWHAGARERSVRCLDRPPRGDRAPRRRSLALQRQRSAQGRREHQEHARPGGARQEPLRPTGARPAAARARRNRGPLAPWRERTARRVDGRRPCSRDCERPAALAAPWRRNHAAAADGEHHQRGPTRGGRARLPGLPDHARSAPSSIRQALEWSSAVRTATGELLEQRALSTLKAAEGGFGPRLADAKGALDLLVAAVERAGLSLGDQVAFAIDVAATHFYDGAGYRLPEEVEGSAPPSSSNAWSSSWTSTRSSRSRMGWRRTTGTVGLSSARARRPHAGARRRSVHHQCERLERGIAVASPTPSREDEPDRDADRDPRCDSSGAGGGLRAGDLGALGRDHDDFIADLAVGTRPVRSRSDRWPNQNDSPSTTSSCESRSSLVAAPSLPAPRARSAATITAG